jgi:Cu+-exporting ATPase
MAETRIEEKIIRVKNIHCESCAKRIEKKLSKINGIYKIKVNIKNGKVYISFDPAKTSLDEIITEIEKNGIRDRFKHKDERA